MDYDAILLIETPEIVHKFYPISLTQPVSLLIAGGFRLVEHVVTSLSREYSTNIIICTRDYICSSNLQKNFAKLLIEEISDRKIELKFAYLRWNVLRENLSKYDKVIPLPANTLKVDNISSIEIINTKNIDSLSQLLNTMYKNEEKVTKLDYVYDIIRLNTELMREMFRRLDIKDDKLIIEADIDSSAKIEKLCVLYRCKVQPFSHIRSGTVVYPESIVGGEVKNTIVSEFTHKEHYGYVGDSYIGRFVNLGAGTTFSNLKNTRGVIKFLGKHSGMTKLGAVIGDHVKTAIGTLVYSGKSIGPYSHVYNVVDSDVPPFVIYRGDSYEIMDIERLVDQIRRWCHKYCIDIETEITIATRLYKFFRELLNEVRLYKFSLSFK